MTKITFTKNQITQANKVHIELSVQKFNFPTEKGDKEIEKIIFEPSSGSGEITKKDELENILRKDGEIELSFDDEKVKIIVIEPQPSANNNFASCSMASGPAPT